MSWFGEVKDRVEIVLPCRFWHIFGIEWRVWGEICVKHVFFHYSRGEEGFRSIQEGSRGDPGEIWGRSKEIQGKPRGIKLTPMGAKREEKERPWAPRGMIK